MTAFKQLRSGRVIDLARPDLTGIDIAAEIAQPLARLARWTGHTIDADQKLTGYSVAQHCVVGADALAAETGCTTHALLFLLHDAHEALIGDIPPPVVAALDEYMEQVLRVAFGETAAGDLRLRLGAGAVPTAVAGLKRRIDEEIHRLAGLPPVNMVPRAIRDAVAEMDRRMLDVERRQLLGPTRGMRLDDVWPASVLKARPVRLHGGPLTPWPPKKAAAEWMRRFELWRIRPRADDGAGLTRAPDIQPGEHP